MTDKQRSDFEAVNPKPKNVWWSGERGRYIGVSGGLLEIERYQARWEGWQAAQLPAQTSSRELEAANMEGYEEACRVISDGLDRLMNSIGLPCDAWGDDAAEASVISGILRRMADDLGPIPVQYDEEENEIRIVDQQPAQAVPDGLIRFAKSCLDVSCDGLGMDGDEIQEFALRCGLIEPHTVTEPCGDPCACSEATGFPATCYRSTALLTTHQESDS